MTENYLQHAEHYIRIIQAAQAAQAQHYAAQPPQVQQQQPYIGDNANSSGNRPQPPMDRQPDIVEQRPEPVAVRESAPPAPQPAEVELVPAEEATRELANGRQRRRRRPAGGAEGRANGVPAEVSGNTAQPVIKADLPSDDLLS